MSRGQKFETDYIDVATRIAEVRGDAEKHYPEGSFQPLDAAHPYRLEVIDGQAYVVYVAAFYRTPDDTRPGVGAAWETVPGRTAFTRGSELQNAETSAWGRALIAALAADSKRGIASAEEVRNRKAEQDPDQRLAERHRPAEDPWEVVEVDGVWVEEWLTRLTAAGEEADLATLWTEAVAAQKNRKIDTATADMLIGQWKTRRAELTGTPEAAA